jgi:CYTH domain-containing protein
MGLEIERRFLVTGSDWQRHVRWSRKLQQGYLATSPEGFTVRVRLSEEQGGAVRQAWLTLKAPAGGIARHEFEYPIPPDDAQALLALAPHRLRKCRHGLDLPGGDWVLDVFEERNAPLVLAEVELASVEQSLAVPFWCVREVSESRELSNAGLARHPYGAWEAGARAALWAGLEGAEAADVAGDTVGLP